MKSTSWLRALLGLIQSLVRKACGSSPPRGTCAPIVHASVQSSHPARRYKPT